MGHRLHLTGLFVIIVLLFQGCEKLMDKSVTGFTTGFYDLSFTLNPIETGNQIIDKKILNSDINNFILAEAGKELNLKSVTLNEVKVQVGSGATFDDFSILKITISAPGHPEKVVAETTSIPSGTKSMILNTCPDDLTGYLHAGRYTIKTVGILKSDLRRQLQVLAQIKYNVKVGV